MMSSSKNILLDVRLGSRTYKLGLPGGGNPEDEADPETRLRRLQQKHEAEIAVIRKRLEAEKDAAFVAGRGEGFEQATQEAGRRLAAEQARWAGLMNQLAEARRKAFAVSETQLIDLVIAAVDKIVGGRPEQPEKIADTLREAFDLLSTKDKLSIICSPADAAFIKTLLADHRNEFEDIAKFTVREDPAIQSGGCLVETEWGTIDARVEKRLAVLKQVWREAARESATEDTGVQT